MPSFIAYVDESGDEGFQFDKGSSRWFVLSAVVFQRSVEPAETKLVDQVRDAINAKRPKERQIPLKKPLHFRDLKHDARRYYAESIGLADLQTITICISKPHLTSPERFREEEKVYPYATRLLLERLIWFCRDHRRTDDADDGTVEIIFSERKGIPESDFRSKILQIAGDVGAEGVIVPNQVLTLSPGRRKGLQIADAVASSTYFALEKGGFGMVEDAYLRALSSRIYRKRREP